MLGHIKKLFFLIHDDQVNEARHFSNSYISAENRKRHKSARQCFFYLRKNIWLEYFSIYKGPGSCALV